MMTINQLLLLKLSEECNETAQRASKAMQFGMEEVQANFFKPGEERNNRERLVDEFKDIVTIALILQMRRVLPDLILTDAEFETRCAKVGKYLKESQRLGQTAPGSLLTSVFDFNAASTPGSPGSPKEREQDLRDKIGRSNQP